MAGVIPQFFKTFFQDLMHRPLDAAIAARNAVAGRKTAASAEAEFSGPGLADLAVLSSDAKPPRQDGAKPIVIVGSGFAGSMLLVHTLLKIADDPTLTQPVKILMLERKPEQLHAGLAYSKGPEYRGNTLNIGAKRVVPFAAGKVPEGFPTFVQYIENKAKENPELLHALTNPPRQMFGDYIHHLVGLAIEKAGKKAQVTTNFKDAVDVQETPAGVRVINSDGSRIDAAHVILATGFQDAIAPKFARAAEKSGSFCAAPYAVSANRFFDEVMDHPKSDVLIIGTGLTAMDCAGRLLNSGFKGQITMMSRRSLMHNPYEPTPVQEYVEKRLRGEPRPESELPFTKEPPQFMKAETIQQLTAAVIKEFGSLTAEGYTSEEILNYWERFVPAVAKKLPHADLAGLLAANDVLITTSRVGVTPDIGMTVRDAVERGQITISSGSIHDVEQRGGKMVCQYTPGDGSVSISLRTHFNAQAPRKQEAVHDYVISAMGNTVAYDPATTEIRHPLWNKLMTSGQAVPHWTKMGIEVTDDFAMVDKNGEASKHISVIGVPVAGHMMVTAYPYAEKPGAGGRLGPPAMNVAGITTGILAYLSADYEQLTEGFRKNTPQPQAAAKKTSRPASR